VVELQATTGDAMQFRYKLVIPTAATCPPDNCSWCFTLHTRASCQPSEPLRPVHRCLLLKR
ncbi:hypothetical protein, partial [Pseudomonas cyclaminis]|uniref:hypothetical protein n=1 Tax=Pseudomonas cyclaminis TaxID=2781239 RepID=UPI00382EC739